MAEAADPQLLPVRLLSHEPGALGLNHVGGVGHVLAQLRVAQDGQRRLGKGSARMQDRGLDGSDRRRSCVPPLRMSSRCWRESAAMWMVRIDRMLAVERAARDA